jgi:hypothetical protein
VKHPIVPTLNISSGIPKDQMTRGSFEALVSSLKPRSVASRSCDCDDSGCRMLLKYAHTRVSQPSRACFFEPDRSGRVALQHAARTCCRDFCAASMLHSHGHATVTGMPVSIIPRFIGLLRRPSCDVYKFNGFARCQENYGTARPVPLSAAKCGSAKRVTGSRIDWQASTTQCDRYGPRPHENQSGDLASVVPAWWRPLWRIAMQNSVFIFLLVHYPHQLHSTNVSPFPPNPVSMTAFLP